MKEFALTTIDNPFDPFEQFDEWLMWDNANDHGCCSLLDRFANVSDEMPSNEYQKEIERAINEILIYDFENKFKKVSREIAE